MDSRKCVPSSSLFYRWSKHEGLRDWGPCPRLHNERSAHNFNGHLHYTQQNRELPAFPPELLALYDQLDPLANKKVLYSAHSQKGRPVLIHYLNLQIFAKPVWTLLKLVSSLEIGKLNKQKNEWKLFQAKRQEDSGLSTLLYRKTPCKSHNIRGRFKKCCQSFKSP